MKPVPVKDTQQKALLPAIESRRKLPINLREQDLDLFRHELVKRIPATGLRTLRNVRISPDGILFKQGKILPESFAFPFLRNQWKRRSVVKFLGRSYLQKTRTLEAEAVWITDAWSTGYFHWLTDALSKWFLIKNLPGKRILLLPHHYENLDYVHGALRAFGINCFQFIGAHEVVRCERLLMPTPVAPSGHFREEIIRAVRGQLVRHFGAPLTKERDRRMYVSRERASKRRIANEGDVQRLLTKFGFEIFRTEDLSFADQVKLASQARYLVSNHGAGLTNMMFLQAGGSILELRHQADRVNNCYFIFASALELDYFYQSCEPLKAGEDPHTADLVVDTKALEQNVTLMMQHRAPEPDRVVRADLP